MTDFYQSPADKLRFEILLKSLKEGNLNLAIVGEDEVALASYGRQIYDHLIDMGEEYVEWWSSADSEKLVQRFNDILAELTLDEALDKSQKRSPKRYMIFPDTHSIQDFELQLLARLINGFPTSNINLVLVVNQLDPYEEKLAVFGKNLLQWILESENPGAPKAPRRTNRIETLEESPKSDLPQQRENALADFSATFAATLASGKFAGPGEGANKGGVGLEDPLSLSPGERPAANTEEFQGQDESLKPKSLGNKVALVLILAIVLTASALGFLYKDEVLNEAQNLQDFVSGKKPAVAKATAPNPSGAQGKEEAKGGGKEEGAPSVKEENKAGEKADLSPTPNPAVGMSSSSSLPPKAAVKTNDSLIPNKEEVVSSPINPNSNSNPKPKPTPTPSEVLGLVGAKSASTNATQNNATQNQVQTNVNANANANANVPSQPQTQDASKVASVSVNSPQSTAVPNNSSKSEQTDAKATSTTSAPDKPGVKNDSEPPKKDLKKEAKKTTSAENKADLKSEPKTEPKTEPNPEPKQEPKPGSVAPTPAQVIAQTASTGAVKTLPAPRLEATTDAPKLAPKTDSALSKSSKPESFKHRPEDQKWVQQLPEEGFVMQHAALDSAEEARTFQQSSPFYKDAKVMYTKRGDSAPYFIVVTGPYASRQEAEAETRKHPVMAKSWIRSAKSLKAQFAE
jgi:hypothetical protein